MARFAQGKFALAVSDISGQSFPWNEMVTQWNGLFVHYSEFESKQPQLDPKPSAADPTALTKSRPQQPSQYWVQRFIDRVTVTLYTTPSSSQAGSQIQFYYMKRIEDAGAYTNAADVPYYYIPCMCAGLAYYVSMKYAPDRTQNLKLLYEDELLRAEAADGSEASTYITPKTYYPSSA